MRSAAADPAGWAAMPGPDGTGPQVTVGGEPSGAARAAGGITLGVEEEFMLLDPSVGAAVPAGPDLARMLGGEPGVQPELMRFQVETATPVCTSLDDLGRELARLRRLAAGAAASAGCRLVASGTAPYRAPGLAAITDQPRYRDLARRYGPLAAEAGSTCGCHVHVGVPSRDLGVQVLARGLAGLGADPFTGQAADARTLRSRLLDHVYPALSDRGDAQTITGLLRRLDDQGTGADRQRALFASAGSAPGFTEALARATLSGDEPARGGQPNAKSGRPPPAWTPGPAPVVPLPRTP